MKSYLLLISLLFNVFLFGQKDIWINEVMGNSLETDGVKSHDWLELYNSSNKEINLKGWYLSDDYKNTKKWKFPNVKIKGNSYFIIYLSGLNFSKKNEIHTNFKLNASGESLTLSNDQGNLIDFVEVLPCVKGTSYGRVVEQYEKFERQFQSTKNASNLKSNGIQFSHQEGVYDYFFELKLNSNSGDTIRYTEDGSIPNKRSKIYNSSIKINSRVDEVDVLSPFAKGSGTYLERKSIKGSVIRAATFNNGNISSSIYTRSFFTDSFFLKKYKDFNIVSLVTDQNNLFQKDSGIYTDGGKRIGFENYNQRGSAWQRQAHISFFNEKGILIFSQGIDIRIHGQVTRKYPSKSFRIYADKKYGASSIRTNIFNPSKTENHQMFLLKSCMGDLQKTVFKDELTSYICRDLNVDIASFVPCILFINGEYWGIYNLKEYLNENYIKRKYKGVKDSVNIVIHGVGNKYSSNNIYKSIDNKSLSMFYNYTQSLNISEIANFSIISNFFNVKSIIDFYCAQLFFGNTDYLSNNNKLWNIGANGVWNQFLFDLDYCWMDPKLDNLTPLLNSKSSSRHPSYATLLFRTLISNPKFTSMFLERINLLMSNEFSEDKLLMAIELFKMKYKPVIREHLSRWGQPGSMSQWERKISYLSGFAKSRHKYFTQYLTMLES